MRRAALIFAFLLLAAPALAQDAPTGNWNQEYDPHVAAIGLSLGYTSGTGLAARWPAFPQVMMSVAGGVWGKTDDLAWNFGTELHLILRQVGRVRFYTGPAIAFYSDDSEDDTDVNFSAGVGLEVLIRPRISVKTSLDFTYLGDKGDVYPLPQVAMFFYF